MRAVNPMPILFCLLAMLLFACAPQTTVVTLHKEPRDNDEPFHRYLVMHVSDDSTQRQAFESALLDELERHGIDAVAAHDVSGMASTAEINQAITIAGEVGADAVLRTQFASIKTETEVEEGRTDVQSTCRGGDLEDYFLYDYEVVTEPVTLKIVHDVVAISSVFDVATQEKLWNIQSTCLDRTSMDEIMADEASAIVGQLRYDGLAR